MTKTHALKGAVAALAVTVATVVGVTLTPAANCQTVNAYAVSEATVNADLAHGWFSLPTDHAERIYSPACR